MSSRRSPRLRRSWLFLPGAESALLDAGPASGPDVLIHELEDFTPPGRRPEARRLAAGLYDRWRKAGVLAGVRVNPLEGDGREDLAAAMRGRPDIVMLPKVTTPDQIAALDRAIAEHERALGIPPGDTEIVPNAEQAAGLVRTAEIVAASPRVTACLVAAEDMAADLGAERSREGVELAYVRARFLVECVAAGTVAIDAPYTFSDMAGVEAETRHARRLGYVAKAIVMPQHVVAVNALLTPSNEEVARARRVVAAFEAARARGQDRIELDGAMVEVPTYLNARRLIARAEALTAAAIATAAD
ncbi:MAG: CoA ester lyase [Rhodospirillales bacterium]|nr:CoA ester lyase [Rhodospirillales bacterium]